MRQCIQLKYRNQSISLKTIELVESNQISCFWQHAILAENHNTAENVIPTGLFTASSRLNVSLENSYRMKCVRSSIIITLLSKFLMGRS